MSLAGMTTATTVYRESAPPLTLSVPTSSGVGELHITYAAKPEHMADTDAVIPLPDWASLYVLWYMLERFYLSDTPLEDKRRAANCAAFKALMLSRSTKQGHQRVPMADLVKTVTSVLAMDPLAFNVPRDNLDFGMDV